MSTWRLLLGDCRESMRTLPAESVQCCVSSPPYWGLRDYGHDGQLGLEPTPDAYVASMVAVFREVRRVLRPDGTLWLNLGDSYASTTSGTGARGGSFAAERSQWQGAASRRDLPMGCKPKDLVGIPWRVAFALQADGWYLRSDIIWAKPNPMPESVTDRPTKSHEYLFLLSRSERYYYDAGAIAEPVSGDPDVPRNRWDTKDYETPGQKPQKRTSRSGNLRRTPGCDVVAGASHVGRGFPWEGSTRNARSVWTIATQPYSGAHSATFPPELAERCIKAGSKPGDTVLDPFAGSGTTGMVATGHGRDAIMCELNPEYAHLIRERCGPMLEAA
jgi:DNA modification methylase